MKTAYVIITFTNGLKNKEIESFINESLQDVELVKVEGNQAILYWPLGKHDELHDIDIELFYALDAESVGYHISFYPK